MVTHLQKNNKILKFIAKKRGKIFFNKSCIKSPYIIIDFYNVYCSYIKFNIIRHFSKETVIMCIDNIMKNINKDQQVIFVMKNIFEFGVSNIKDISKIYKNSKFVIVKDLYITNKSNNMERDDYICIAVQNIIRNYDHIDSIIISNDHYSNYTEIIKTMKPVELIFIINEKISKMVLSEEFLKKELYLEHKPFLKRVSFSFDNYN